MFKHTLKGKLWLAVGMVMVLAALLAAALERNELAAGCVIDPHGGPCSEVVTPQNSVKGIRSTTDVPAVAGTNWNAGTNWDLPSDVPAVAGTNWNVGTNWDLPSDVPAVAGTNWDTLPSDVPTVAGTNWDNLPIS